MNWEYLLYALSVGLLVLYALFVIVLFIYSLAVLQLTFNFKKAIKAVDFVPEPPLDWPFVTIQLPIYNEQYVVERLLDTISQMDYPKDKFEIQVLDDSTDTTKDICLAKCKELREAGLNVSYLHRKNRKGFKAGALREGLEKAKGEFIAIFDADFLPKNNWLKQTVIHFKDAKIGLVQTRWGHINRDYSWLTKILAFALDAHFTLEQVGRNTAHHFINFNGTAGIWRKACIVAAGNWQSDTLTEDLDLSYRAQLKNWKFKYLPHVVAPAELPAVISAARSQQFRWNKGAAENFLKLVTLLWKTKNLDFASRIHGTLHLLNSSVFLIVFLMSLISVPILYIKNYYPELGIFFNFLSFFLLTTVIFLYCYWQSYKFIFGNGWRNFLNYISSFIKFYTLVLGFAFHNSVAVIEGFLGYKSEFVRTPKFAVAQNTAHVERNTYLKNSISPSVWAELVLLIYFLFGIALGIALGDLGLMPFHVLLSIGFGFIAFNSIFRK